MSSNDNFESQVLQTGKSLLSYDGAKGFGFLSPHKWSQALLDKMMGSEPFRVASLRFTDVAPTLRNDGDFMEHLTAYYGQIDGMEKFLGNGIPAGKFLGKVIAPVVRQNIRGMAGTFIAGETIADGIKTFKGLHSDGLACSIDLLGEAVISKTEAEAFTQSYHDAIEQIAKATQKWGGAKYPEQDKIGIIARANVSVKLSALYEHISPMAHDHSVEVLTQRFADLMANAKIHNAYVHIDTEQWELLPITTEVFHNVLMDERFRDYPHVGIVCQAYLRESDKFLQTLIDLAQQRGTPFSIRLVKGAYWDYEQAYAEQMGWDCPVFDYKEETDINYEKLLRVLIEAFPTVRPLIGSHNARSLAVAITLQREFGLEKQDIEFQVLNGMAPNFRDALRDMGYRVRQYCPVGAFIPGMSYLVRRLLENTANQSFVAQKAKGEVDVDTLLAPPQMPEVIVGKERSSFTNQPLRDFSRILDRANAEDAIEDIKQKLPFSAEPVLNGKVTKTNTTIDHTCPWQTNTLVTRVTCATAQHADQAVAIAKEALPAWHKMGFAARADILDKAADIMQQNWQELFAMQVYEAGKDWASADGDIAEATDFLRYYAQQARTLEEDFQPNSVWGENNTLRYEPRGVAAVIAPWNFPLAISVGMTAANLVAGNPVIYKPAEQTSGIGLQMYSILREAGVPQGVLHFLPGDGAEVGARLVEHPDVASITFTGSKEVGLKILEQAGKVTDNQGQIKKCVIEMGGKNATIIDADADLDEAIPAVVHAAFGFQGQKCSATSRVIVVGSAYDTFIKRLSETVVDLRVGGADEPTNDTNAVIDMDARDKIESYIKIGKEDGRLLAQAFLDENTATQGHFIAPSVFVDLNEDSTVASDEIFGPVLTIHRAKTVEQAVKMALNSNYRLTGAVFTRNPNTISYVKEHFRVGNLYINRGSTGALVARQPFGGGGLSGTGTKAGGKDYLLNFVEPRVVTENTMRRGFAPKND